MSSPNWPARLAPLWEHSQLPALAHGAAAREPDTAVYQLLLLEVAGRRLAIDILHVAEVAKGPAITFVPHTPAFHLGIASVRGTLLPIVSLAHVLGLSPPSAQRGPCASPVHRVIVLRGAAPIGLAVDHVLQVIRLRQQELMPPSSDAAAGLPWAAAFASIKEGLTAVLSVDALERLLRSLQARPNAAAP